MMSFISEVQKQRAYLSLKIFQNFHFLSFFQKSNITVSVHWLVYTDAHICILMQKRNRYVLSPSPIQLDSRTYKRSERESVETD